MELICVPTGPDDAEALLDMMRDYYPIEGATFRPEVQGPALRALLADPALGRVYLVRRDGKIAGYVVLTFDYGLGTRVLDFVSRACRELGGRALHLAVGFKNGRARAVYEKHGFVPTRREMMTLALVD